jgi:hypothetical protein
MAGIERFDPAAIAPVDPQGATMRYFELEPEVGGFFGPASVADVTKRPPIVSTFNYEFDTWLGDPILEALCAYIVTDDLKDRLTAAGASGISFGPVEITKSDIFEGLQPDETLPAFSWLQVVGKPGSDDFGLSENFMLVVSERILELLKQAGMKHCTIVEYRPNAKG